MGIDTTSKDDRRRFWGVSTEELQLHLSSLRQDMRDVVEDATLADSTRQNSLSLLNHWAVPIVTELARRKEQLSRFAGTPLADVWPDAGRHNALVERKRRLKSAASLSSYIIARFPNSDLHRTGRDTWTGRCIFPDHPDTDPSLVVYDDNRFTCFGCNRHGDIIQAIAIADDLQRFTDLVDTLARWVEEGGGR